MAIKSIIPLRFRDLDGMGHVNNAVYLSYIEVARMDFWKEYFSVKEPYDFPFILARVEIDYRRALEIKDEAAHIEIAVSRIGNGSWDFHYLIRDLKETAVFAEAKSIQVAFDYNQKQTVMIPGNIRKVLDENFVAIE